MLTQTLRRMERDGVLVRTIFPVVPPKVEYRLTGLGLGLGAAFCGVWVWAAENLDEVELARRRSTTERTPVDELDREGRMAVVLTFLPGATPALIGPSLLRTTLKLFQASPEDQAQGHQPDIGNP